jgi:protein-disulfide isomerase-like protein with CxxC motif
LTIDLEGDFAKQHLMLISAANAMLAAPQLVAALKRIVDAHYEEGADVTAEIIAARAALASAGA